LLDKRFLIRYTTHCKENYFTGGALMDDMIMDEKLKEKVELSILFDFYGELIKSHNKHIFEDYILNDLSLSEIAEEQGISRQGVYDIVKRCSKQLRNSEEKLNLVKKFEKTKAKVNRIKELSIAMKAKGNNISQGEVTCQDVITSQDDMASLVEIINLSENILQEL
jgi:hypothetical protein